MFASDLSGLPFSFTAHAKDIYTSDPRQLAEKIRKARFAVTCTEYNRRHLCGLVGNGDGHVFRVYHGIDQKLFRNGSVPRRPAPPFRVLTVARMIPKKGLPTVYRALRILLDRGFELRHDLIGDGEDRDRTLETIRDLGLGSYADCPGTKPHHEVLEYYRRADLFVVGCEVAANGDRDGIPNVLVESMAMGVPVVATDVSAIPELVTNEETGLLVPSRDPEELARAMERLLTDMDLRGRVIAAAQKRVARDFDNRKLITELAAIYRNNGLSSG